MKLILLYGPPGVGKLTVGKELAKITLFKLFHNHLTVDLVSSLFAFDTPIYWKYIHKYRFELLEAAAKNNINCIFTFCYAKKTDDHLVRKMIGKIEKHGGKVLLVQLKCTRKELLRRVRHPARKNFLKIKRVKKLESVMKKHDLTSVVPFGKNLSIDNTRISPKRTAQKIVDYFKLDKVRSTSGKKHTKDPRGR